MIELYEYLMEAKLPRSERKKKRVSSTLHAYDADETLFGHDHTKLKVGVKDKEGKKVKDLTNQEFNTHKLDKDHSYDFKDFRSTEKFKDSAKPNKAMIKDLKRKVKRKKPVNIVTARSDFDDGPGLVKHLGKYGINANKGNVHIRRTGNLPGNDVGEKKRQTLKDLAAKEGYKKVHMYDDAKKVLHSTKKLKQDGIQVKNHFVKPDKKGVVRGRPFKEEVSLDEARKRDHLANAILAGSFALGAMQSPEHLVTNGKGWEPGVQLMSTMMQKRKKADANLDSNRVSHPARNIKKESTNYNDFLSLLEAPLYEVEGKTPTCKKGYKWDSKIGGCIPIDPPTKKQEENKDFTPGDSQQYNMIGSNGMDGGYALAEPVKEGKIPWDNGRAPLKSGWTPREKNRAKRILQGVEDPDAKPTDKNYERYGNLLDAHKTQSNIRQPKPKDSHQYKSSGPFSRLDIKDSMTRSMFHPQKTKRERTYNVDGPDGLKEPVKEETYAIGLAKYKKKDDEEKVKLDKQKARMKYGKSGKPSGEQLGKGEYKYYDKESKQWVSAVGLPSRDKTKSK